MRVAPHVVIVGGLYAAKALRRAPVRVTGPAVTAGGWSQRL
jgi:hypothetical protein